MLGNIGPWQLLIVLVIVMLVFGTKRIRNIGSDLGAALRGFRKGVSEDEPEPQLEADPPAEETTEAHQESSEKH
jgi:sec-independent protein translocase protein TatA